MELIEELQNRLEQLKAQIDDPEVLNQERVHTKIEVYDECISIVKNHGASHHVSDIDNSCVKSMQSQTNK